MTPDEIAAFRAKLAMNSADDQVPGGPSVPSAMAANAPSTPESEMASRIRRYGGDFANNPGVRQLGATINPIGTAINAGVDYAAERGGIGRRDPTFMREAEGGPQFQELRPMASQELALPNTPTLASMGNPARLAPMGGGGFGSLIGAARNAQGNTMRTLDREKDLIENRGDLQSERIDKEAELQQLAAARMKRDAEVQKEHDEQAMVKHEAFLARNQQLADDIGKEKIEPGRLMSNTSTGGKIGLMIAGLLNGAAGQGPAFMSRISEEIDRDVKAQMANVDNKKASLSARQNLFGQMMAESGDRRVAEAQTRNLIYESVKQDMAARAARLGIPEVKNNAQLALTEIQATKQDPLLQQIADGNLRSAQAAAAASAAAQRQAEDRTYQRGKDVFEMSLKDRELKLKEEEAGGGADGLDKAGRGAIALEAKKAQLEMDANVKSIGMAKADAEAITAGGTVGNVWSHAPSWVPGATGAQKDVNTREAYNRRVMMAVGASFKLSTDATEPKRKEMLEHFAEPFIILPSDNKEIALTKMTALEKQMKESAASRGTVDPATPGSLKFK